MNSCFDALFHNDIDNSYGKIYYLGEWVDKGPDKIWLGVSFTCLRFPSAAKAAFD